jgi:N-acyl homoserine lactone hydrolase
MTSFKSALLPALLLAVSAYGAQPPKSVRLYVFDCGSLNIPDPERYNLTRADIVTNMMSVPCFLVAHPKGSLIWDTGVIPDGELKPDGTPVTQGNATVSRALKPQMAAVGYAPADITYLAFSHFHFDHTANGNMFASATWLVRPLEREVMLSDPPSTRTIPARFSDLKNSKSVIVKDNEYDVFGDKSVIIKSAAGHSPDHQVLFVKLAKTGPVVLSGDLWHYPEERKLNRFPKTEFNLDQTVASRAAIEAFMKKTGAQLWIEHDFTANAKLKKAPAYYE